MKNEKASISETLSIIKEAVEFKVKRYNVSSYERDDYPLYGLGKLFYIFSTLRPKELKEAVNVISSYNFGKHILTAVFPKNENPDEYHSKDGVVCLSESPIQVLGWEEQKQMVKEGVEMGFNSNWIDFGFYDEAENRGIDLEWSFFEKPPKTNDISNNLKQIS